LSPWSLWNSGPCRIGSRCPLQPRYIAGWVARFHGRRVASVPWSLDGSCPMMPGDQGRSGHRRSSPSRDIGTEVLPGPRSQAGAGNMDPMPSVVHRSPGIAAALVADVPRPPWNQGARASSDRGTGHDDAPRQASRRRQLGTFMSSATLVPRLDGTLDVPDFKVIAAPIPRGPHGPDTDDLPRRLRWLEIRSSKVDRPD
jgi:hypothetical protein